LKRKAGLDLVLRDLNDAVAGVAVRADAIAREDVALELTRPVLRGRRGGVLACLYVEGVAKGFESGEDGALSLEVGDNDIIEDAGVDNIKVAGDGAEPLF
jgi:hypothetical protein